MSSKRFRRRLVGLSKHAPWSVRATACQGKKIHLLRWGLACDGGLGTCGRSSVDCTRSNSLSREYSANLLSS